MSNLILESIDKMFEEKESLESSLRTIIDLYYEDKCNEDGDCFAGTEDSYAEEMLLQRIDEISDEYKFDTDKVYSAVTLADSEEQAVEKALEAAKEITESEFDAADIVDSWDEFMQWVEADENRIDAAKRVIPDKNNVEDVNTESKEFIDLFRRFKEDTLEEDQQLSKLDLMAGEVITQLEQIKKADTSVKIDRPYIEQYMNTAYGSSSALDDKDVGYILGRVLKHYNLAESEEYLSDEMKKKVNAAMDRSIKQQDKEAEEDDEELEISLPRIVRDVCKELNISKEDKPLVSKYIKGSLRYYSESELHEDSNFNPSTRRQGDEEDRKKMVQRDAGEIDPERREKAIARIKKYWPRVPKSWLNSRTDEYLEQTADHYEAMEARKLAAKQKQANVS